MTSCSTCELGPRFFVSAGMSCIRVSWLPFLRFFVARGRGLPSCRALDNIERLIPFPPAVEYSASTCVERRRRRTCKDRRGATHRARALRAPLGVFGPSGAVDRRKGAEATYSFLSSLAWICCCC